MEKIGQRLINVLLQAWKEPFTTKSDFARTEADYVAQAAELGLITVTDEDGVFGNIWKITQPGIRQIFLWKVNQCGGEVSGVLRILGIVPAIDNLDDQGELFE